MVANFVLFAEIAMARKRKILRKLQILVSLLAVGSLINGEHQPDNDFTKVIADLLELKITKNGNLSRYNITSAKESHIKGKVYSDYDYDEYEDDYENLDSIVSFLDELHKPGSTSLPHNEDNPYPPPPTTEKPYQGNYEEGLNILIPFLDLLHKPWNLTPNPGVPQYEYPDVHHFDGYRKVWLKILEELYRIIKDKSILHESLFSEEMLNQLFYLLEDVKIMEDHSDVLFCPRSFYKEGKICLAVQFITEFLDYKEARLYCQVVLGGDLAIFRDADEFADMQRYIQKIDHENKFSYWVGLSDEHRENDWRFIDGRSIMRGAPFWGRTLRDCTENGDEICRRRQSISWGLRNNIPVERDIQPESDNSDENYALLLNLDHYYIHDASNSQAETWRTIPLCQYVPERDETNLQYGEAIADQWSIVKDRYSGYHNYGKETWSDPYRHEFSHAPLSE